MAPLNFVARESDDGERRFHLTFGRYRAEFKWDNKRELTFDEIKEMLSAAPPGAKDGPCFVPGWPVGHTRRKDLMERVDLVLLDADCGHPLSQIKAAVEARGWRAIIHSTHSHLTEQTIIAADPTDKWMQAHPGATIGAYMAEEKSYLPEVVVNSTILDEAIIDNKTRGYVVKHFPCPKYRIILPLDKPWIAAEFESQALANATWKERIGALASFLGLQHDQSCTDTSRLYYLPRTRENGPDYECSVLEGEDCGLWDLPDAVKAGGSLFDGGFGAVEGKRSGSVIDRPKFSVVGVEATAPDTGEVFDLVRWMAQYGSRFEVAKALSARSGGTVFSKRITGVKRHIYCPHSGSHSSVDDGTGAFVVDASMRASAEMPEKKAGFIVHCSHNGCAGRDRLDYVKAWLEAGTLEVADLTDPRFLMPGDAGAGFAVVGGRMVPQMVERVAERERQDTGKAAQRASAGGPRVDQHIPATAYAGLPGALGAMHEWILATSPKPQPVLALGAVLAFAAAVIGRRVKAQRWEIRPNIYVLGVAYSGAGKDRPMAACKAVARAAGLLDELIGVEEIASDTGIVNSVMAFPRQVMLIDEISHILNIANGRNAGSHLQGIASTLLKLYSSSDQVFKSKSYADLERVKTIDQPCVSLYGSCVPTALADALTTKDIQGGLLSRMMIFNAGDHDPRIQTPKQVPLPNDLVDWVMAWDRVSPVVNPLHRVGSDQLLEPRTVMVTDDANDIAMAFADEMHDAKLDAKAVGKDALYVRAFENAVKFALIRACAGWHKAGAHGPEIDESELRIDAECMRWAVDLSRATIEGMVQIAGGVADNQFAQTLKAYLDMVKRCGPKGATYRDIARSAAGRLPKKMLDDVEEALTRSGEMKFLDIKGNGRVRRAWVHHEFLHLYGVNADDDEDAGEGATG